MFLIGHRISAIRYVVGKNFLEEGVKMLEVSGGWECMWANNPREDIQFPVYGKGKFVRDLWGRRGSCSSTASVGREPESWVEKYRSAVIHPFPVLCLRRTNLLFHRFQRAKAVMRNALFLSLTLPGSVSLSCPPLLKGSLDVLVPEGDSKVTK